MTAVKLLNMTIRHLCDVASTISFLGFCNGICPILIGHCKSAVMRSNNFIDSVIESSSKLSIRDDKLEEEIIERCKCITVFSMLLSDILFSFYTGFANSCCDRVFADFYTEAILESVGDNCITDYSSFVSVPKNCVTIDRRIFSSYSDMFRYVKKCNIIASMREKILEKEFVLLCCNSGIMPLEHCVIVKHPKYTPDREHILLYYSKIDFDAVEYDKLADNICNIISMAKVGYRDDYCFVTRDYASFHFGTKKLNFVIHSAMSMVPKRLVSACA